MFCVRIFTRDVIRRCKKKTVILRNRSACAVLSMAIGLVRAVVILVAVWLVVVLMIGPLFHSSDNTEQIVRQLGRAMDQLELLKKQNEEFRVLLADFRLAGNEVPPPCSDDVYRQLQTKLDRAADLLRQTEAESRQQQEQLLLMQKAQADAKASASYSLESQKTLRRVERGVKEMWFYVKSELSKLKAATKETTTQAKIDDILEDVADHKRTILVDLRNFSRLDGRNEFVRKEIEELTDLVQHRIQVMQHPPDCTKATKVICNLNKGCGYGCQLHHAVYCFMVGYGSQRTLILKSQGWRYNREGWEAVFQPVSNSCTSDFGLSHSSWPGTDRPQVITLPIIDSLHPRPPYLPLAVPRDIADRLSRVHGDPSVWWIAQFVRYLLRPQEHLAKFLVDMQQKMEFARPIVGVHVRRTDKVGTEAAFHGIDEYMHHVIDYYKMLEMEQEVPKKRVYLASDDPSVLEEARRKYPDFTFLGDQDVAKSASITSRYSDNSLRGIILDIQMLAYTDYLVCTFSSQVCRVAYEIMQSLHPDASSYFYSLDDVYYFGGQNAHNQVALYSHHGRRPGEISFERGDILGIAGNHWDGYSKGVNRRTKQDGLYPSYKAEDLVDVADVPTYDESNEVKPGPGAT